MKSKRLIICIFVMAQLLLSACGSDNENLDQLNTAVSGTTVTPALTTRSAINAAVTPYNFQSKPSGATAKNASQPLVITLDQTKTGLAISPLIYGLAGSDDSDPNYNNTLRPGLARWGGYSASRYNWVLGNAWNTGHDYQYRNTDYGNPGKNVANEAISANLKANIPMLLTIPTLGWVARNTDQNVRSLNVPEHGGPPLTIGSQAILGYDPTANRALTSVQSKARKNAPFVTNPDPNSPIVYQDEWVASLVKQFGPARSGGVRLYAMDNEPELWSETQTDVHPTRMGYDDLLSTFEEYASAVKDVDPSAEITGPVTGGWAGYFYSELDRGSDAFKTAGDRALHNNQPFLAWFLEQLHRYESEKGRRLLDVLDVHFYPQNLDVYNGKTDPETNAARLRATRSLWDNNYIDESWIGTQIRLIPRLQEWISAYYPGTKLGISEWNFGADTTLNGALAISQVLGVFGREGVYLASYWRFPPKDSPGFYAFKLYTNFDDQGSTFGDKSVPVKISDNSKISSFAALDSKTGHLHLIVINQQPDVEAPVAIQLAQPISAQGVKVYQISAQTGNKLAAQPALVLGTTNKIELTVPAYSVTLYDLQPN